MSDIGLFGPGFNTFLSALGMMLLGSLFAVVGLLVAIVRSRHTSGSVQRDPAAPFAVAGLVGVALGFGLAVYTDDAGFEARAVLDAWLAAIVAGVVLLSALAGWGAKRWACR